MITRVPKKGLATGGDSTALGLGDTEAEVVLIGDGAVGLNALALGLGRNEEALAFRCFVAVPGDIGTAEAEGPVDVEGPSF